MEIQTDEGGVVVKQRLVPKTQWEIEDALRLVGMSKVIAVDTETSGLDPHTCEVWSIQLSDGTVSVLIPLNEVELGFHVRERLQYFLLGSHDHLKVMHNGSFDLKILRKLGLRVTRIYDTLIAEKLLTAGTMWPCDLASTLARRLGVQASKDIRTTFHDGTFSHWNDALVDYALVDVEHLPALAREQCRKLKEEGLLEVAKLEMELVPIVADMEWRGIGFDREAGAAFAAEMAARAAEVEGELQAALDPYWRQVWEVEYADKIRRWNAWSDEWEIIKRETNKRKGLSPEEIQAQKLRRARHQEQKPCTTKPVPAGPINLNSPSQLLPTLQQVVDIPNTRKETLESYTGSHEIIDTLLEYRLYAKLSSAFGDRLIDSINPVTGRIHATFNQIVSTGRFSCSQPNLQQQPARTEEGKRLRSIFRPRPGWKFITADYSGIELVIIAVLSQEQRLLDALNQGLDLHCYTMSLILECEYDRLVRLRKGSAATPEDAVVVSEARQRFQQMASIPRLEGLGTTLPDLTAWVNTLRDYIKTLTYGLAYGLSKFGLSRRLHFSVEAAETIINLFYVAYPNVRLYLDMAGEGALTQGYSVTVLGRKRYYNRPGPVRQDEIDALALSLQEQEPDARWTDLRLKSRRQLERQRFYIESGIRRQGSNAPIQGSSADMTKRAMVLFEQALRKAGWKNDTDVGLVLCVHDELVAEAPDEDAEAVARILKLSMEQAAVELLGSTANVVVEPVVSDYWQH